MKTFVLFGFSGLLLAAVCGVMYKKTLAGNTAGSQLANTSNALVASKKEKAATEITAAQKNNKGAVNPTLIDSNWIDEPLIHTEDPTTTEPAIDNHMQEERAPMEKANPEARKPEPLKSQKPAIQEPGSLIKSLILEIKPADSARQRKIPVDVV
jgi:hypothetical protein